MTTNSPEPTNTLPRVVVAEDEALIRLDLVEMLEDNGYDVVAAVSDGEAALAAVREHRPDLAVFDVKMPAKDGISAAEEIGREHLAPVVLLTAFSDKGLLTTKLGLDEQAAFRWIQKTAMDRRLSMQQVCDGVIAEFGD